ncbi:MAG: NAD(P)/FAD-dependent oxidoreductase [Myxococcales bacterium]|nr:NAD(P)/FAD-dependent oxidoreductase [Myxococcales bacterium]
MYDVIVIGARCAGSPTATLLARAGHRVLLVDRARFPSDTVSTHLVKPRAMAYLRRWGVMDALVAAGAPVRREFSFTREGVTLVGAPDRDALRRCLQREHAWDAADLEACEVEWACIRRRTLDKVLLDAAVAAGVEVREGFAVGELVTDADGRVVGVRGHGERGAAVEERARVVVGADGRHSLVARQAPAAVLEVRPRCTYTVYSYYSGVDVDAFAPPVHLRGRLGVGFAPVRDGQALVSCWGPREWFDGFRSDLEGNLLRTAELCCPDLAGALRAAGRRDEPIHGTVDLANVLRQGAGTGWLLVGDAGCHVDQCTAIGITLAFRDAELAAAAIHRGLAGEEPLDAALAAYDARRLELLRPHFEYVATVAECNPTRHEQLRVLAALRGRREHVARFLGFGALIVPRAEYFTASELAEIVDAAGPALADLPTPAEVEARNHREEINPWR